MLITPDFSDIAEDITPGVYKVTIRKVDLKEWQSGDKYLNWELETFGETETKNNGRRLWLTTPLSGFRGKKALTALSRAALGRTLSGSLETEEFMGKQVEVEVVDGVNYKTGEKTGYTDIKSVRPLTMN